MEKFREVAEIAGLLNFVPEHTIKELGKKQKVVIGRRIENKSEKQTR